MARIRSLLIATLLGVCSTGCSFTHWSLFHCSECDDFPMPGSMSKLMMPGSYTGPPARDYYGVTEPLTAITGPTADAAPPVVPETAPAAPTAPAATPAPPAPNMPPGL